MFLRCYRNIAIMIAYLLIWKMSMPETQIVFFFEENKTIPALDWIRGLNAKAQIKCLARIERLGERGHELRRPEADYLRDGIYELRIGLQGQNYRLLYFFFGDSIAVLSHGLVKEHRVPPKEIDNAIERKARFESDPTTHTYRMEVE